MQTAADLNAAADLMATLYDEVVMLNSEGLDGTNVVTGGDALPLTYSAAGTEGPTEETPAIDGIAWSGVNAFELDDVATYVGLRRDGVTHRTERLPHPVGPGSVPYIHGIGPMAGADD